MEYDGLGLHLAILDVHFVAAQHYGDILADSDKISVPVGDILVGDSRSDIKHDDGALPLNAA